MFKTYKGGELHLEHYKGKSIVELEFEMLDDDDEALDLTRYSEIVLEIYSKRGGTLIDSWDLTDGLSVDDNFISWDASLTEMDEFRIGLTYYHHCYGVVTDQGSPVDANAGQEELLFFGNSPII